MARLFVAFASEEPGGPESPPIDTPVGLYIGNVYQRTLPNGDAAQRASWEVCTDYVGAPCPYSALDAISASPDHRIVSGPATSKCLVANATEPTDTGAPHLVTVTPKQAECPDDYAVQLWINDVGQITSVNLLLAERP